MFKEMEKIMKLNILRVISTTVEIEVPETLIEKMIDKDLSDDPQQRIALSLEIHKEVSKLSDIPLKEIIDLSYETDDISDSRIREKSDQWQAKLAEIQSAKDAAGLVGDLTKNIYLGR